MTTLRLLAASAVLCLAASAKPNFSGTWKLDTEKSSFGPMPAPTSMTREIKHTEPSLQIKTTTVSQQGDNVMELRYTTDGKESTNTTRMGDIKGTAQWEGDALVVRYTIANPQTGEIKFEDRWTLSSSGKVTTVVSKISGGFGEVDRKLFFDKQ